MTKRTFTIYSDDDSVYGYLFDVTRLEAQEVIKQFKMEDVTEQMVEAGWISRAQYEAFKKQNA